MGDTHEPSGDSRFTARQLTMTGCVWKGALAKTCPIQSSVVCRSGRRLTLSLTDNPVILSQTPPSSIRRLCCQLQGSHAFPARCNSVCRGVHRCRPWSKEPRRGCFGALPAATRSLVQQALISTGISLRWLYWKVLKFW